MVRKPVAALAALTLVSTPCAAFDSPSQQSPGVMFYFSVPIDARHAKEQTFAAGLQIQGKRQYETVKVDSRMFNFIGGGIEAKWIIAGVVAAGAVVAVASKDKSTTNSQQQQQSTAELAATSTGGSGSTGDSGTTCPKTPTCP
jgi:hypothetical protein